MELFVAGGVNHSIDANRAEHFGRIYVVEHATVVLALKRFAGIA